MRLLLDAGALVAITRDGDVIVTSDPDDIACLAQAAARDIAILAI